MLSRKRIVLVGAAAVALGVAAAPMATAQGHTPASKGKQSGWSRTISTEVIAPFGIAVDGNTVYVADGALNGIFKIVKGQSTPVAQGFDAPGADVAGVDVADDGTLAYTRSIANEQMLHTAAELVIRKTDGSEVHADLFEYEQRVNPDKVNHYGLPDDGTCLEARAWVDSVTGGLASYNGIQDTHPYAVASLGNGSWAVADAGANAILKVSASGQVSTIAVLPPQPLTITQGTLEAIAVDQEGNPLPIPESASCLIGKTYAFEPVPTDVEVGPRGQLYVSTLPGGPEDPSGGARGSVYIVNPATGSSSRLATGFAAATNLAVHGDGTVYVTQLFGGAISKISRNGSVSTFKEVAFPLALEVRGGFVYAATAGIFAPPFTGAIIQYRR